MRIPWLPFIILLVISLAIDLYVYLSLRKRYKSQKPIVGYTVVSAIEYLVLITAVALPMRRGDEMVLLTKMWLLFAFLSILFPKIVYLIFDLIASIPRLFKRRRWRWMSMVGLVVAGLLFVGMWWGALINRFRTDVVYENIEIAGLPDSFEGYRIVQISDLHVGTYGNNPSFLKKLVEEVNSLNPDLIVFTGDIVNRKSIELEPFTAVLSGLKAKDGVYSILGNHDYGDYYNWPSQQAKDANLQSLKDMQETLGWKLLLNESVDLRRGFDRIALIGVENVGDPPFTVYGDLSKSYPNLKDKKTKILLSHNPAHWDMDIADNDSLYIDLTLSGHTHAMQISAGRAFSPASLRYKHWGGLYKDSRNQKLYVNIGAGTVGLPMRLGATPEITVLTLHRDNN